MGHMCPDPAGSAAFLESVTLYSGPTMNVLSDSVWSGGRGVCCNLCAAFAGQKQELLAFLGDVSIQMYARCLYPSNLCLRHCLP